MTATKFQNEKKIRKHEETPRKEDRLQGRLSTKVVPKLMLTLSRRTCNTIYRNSNKANIFCSSLSSQQGMDICMSNRSPVTIGFVKTVACIPPENERCQKKWTKKWERSTWKMKDGLMIEGDVSGGPRNSSAQRERSDWRWTAFVHHDVWLNIYRPECPQSSSALDNLFHCWHGGALYWR